MYFELTEEQAETLWSLNDGIYHIRGQKGSNGKYYVKTDLSLNLRYSQSARDYLLDKPTVQSFERQIEE